jgi:hypothetical protein
MLAGTSCMVLGAVAQDAAFPGGAFPGAAFPDVPPTMRPPVAPAAASGGVRILSIDGADLSALRNLSGSNVQAVSLNVPLQIVLSDPQAMQSLMLWVREGGTVLLHTNAAQLFGYRTVAPRESTNAVAGQRFGRARAALPFGANPLLWSMRGAPNAAASGGSGAGSAASFPGQTGAVRAVAPLTDVPAVRLVYYQMAPDDQLAYAHPAGVPLLRVADVAAANAGEPLYAAALAAYGRGWAFFLPSLVEQHRADGAAFVQSLLRLIAVSPRGTTAAPSAAGFATSGADVWITFPADLITDASAAASGNFNPANFVGPFALAVFGGDIDETPNTPSSMNGGVTDGIIGDANDDAVADTDATAAMQAPAPGAASTLTAQPSTAGLIMTRREADATARLLNRARSDSTSRARAITALYLLRLRLELQRENLDGAALWLAAAQRVAGGAAETLLWRGALAADDAEERSNTAPARATRWREAATSWSAALSAPSLLATGVQPARDSISGVPRTFVQTWITGAVTAANRAIAEPPLVQVISTGASDITLRHNGNQRVLQYIVPSLQRLEAASRVLGWRSDEEEFLIFPDVDTYANYRAVAGLRQQNFITRIRPNQYYTDEFGNRVLGFPPDPYSEDGEPLTLPSGNLGDVVNGRALTLMPLSVVPQRYLGDQRQRSRILLSPGYLVPIGSLHARALIETLTRGGTPAPPWMYNGLAAMSDRELNIQTNRRLRRDNDNPYAFLPRQRLQGYRRNNLLLGPLQFRGVPTDGSVTTTVASEQALGMMLYFYNRFGVGAVVETLQRLGSRQSVDEALSATTGLTEEQFFVQWDADSFGNRRR